MPILAFLSSHPVPSVSGPNSPTFFSPYDAPENHVNAASCLHATNAPLKLQVGYTDAEERFQNINTHKCHSPPTPRDPTVRAGRVQDCQHLSRSLVPVTHPVLSRLVEAAKPHQLELRIAYRCTTSV
jgi:hypothetical protein